MPSWGFSLAVSGRTIPLFVFSSFSTGLTTTRSPNGLRFMCALLSKIGSIGSPRAQALSTQGGRLPIVLPAGLGPLNGGFGGGCLGLAAEVARGLGLVVRDHHAGVGEVDPDPVGVVAEDLDPEPVGLEDGGHQVGLNALAPEDNRPALNAHDDQPSDGSATTGLVSPPARPDRLPASPRAGAG